MNIEDKINNIQETFDDTKMFRVFKDVANSALGNSPITKEICDRLIELYKICLIINKPYSHNKNEEYRDLFMIKFLEYADCLNRKKEEMHNMSDEDLKIYRDLIAKHETTLLPYLGKSQIQMHSRIKEEALELPAEDVKALITDTYIFNNIVSKVDYAHAKRIVSSLSEEEIQKAKALDVNEDLEMLFRYNAYSESEIDTIINKEIGNIAMYGFSGTDYVLKVVDGKFAHLEYIGKYNEAIYGHKDEMPKTM